MQARREFCIVGRDARRGDRREVRLTMAFDPIVDAADRFYQAGDWATALHLYRNAMVIDSEAALAKALPLAVGHCEIELAPSSALEAVQPAAAPPRGGDRTTIIVSRIRFRALQLCRTHDVARAARLLRFLAAYDPPIADVYARSIDRASGQGVPGGDPRFLAAEGLTDGRVDAQRRQAQGRRLLMIFRRLTFGVATRQYEPIDTFTRAAERFGMVVEHVNSHVAGPDGDARTLAAQIMAAVRDFRPDLIIYDELFTSGVSAGDETAAAVIAEALATARRQYGVKVVNYFLDVWRVPVERIFRGLGDSVDLIAHCHPGALGVGAPNVQDAVFCYIHPIEMPTATVAGGTIAKACFVGSVYADSISRLVWWAETARRGVPLDFLETDHAAARRSDLEFVNLFRAYRLSVNFTRRPTGVTILTARTLQAPLAGGALLEEDSIDSAYFLRRGEHYLGFETIGELTALIEQLLDDPGRCTRMADAARDWVARYFTGDYFWAGLLQRLNG
jgi:hypothetical protein